MDLSPVFTPFTALRPATTGEYALFSSAGISLVHGWLIDPESPEYTAVSHVKDYDSTMNLIFEADVLTRGLFVGNGGKDDGDCAGSSRTGTSDSGVNLSEVEKRRVEESRTVSCNTRGGCQLH
jgi:ubiquitin carboxyl-terminal hydrolase MINDY-1/2